MENRQGKMHGLRFEYAGQTFKASEIGREFGYRSLLNQFGITAQGQKGTSKVPQYPVQRQEQQHTPELQQQQQRERQQSPGLGVTLIEGVANALGGLMTPAHSDYDPLLAEWYESLKRKRKKKKEERTWNIQITSPAESGWNAKRSADRCSPTRLSAK